MRLRTTSGAAGTRERLTLITFCNQDRRGARRLRCLAAVDPVTGGLDWIRAGSLRADFGATGAAALDGCLYVVVQSRRARVVAVDPATWRIVATHRFRAVRDPHSLCVHDGALYVASSGDNAVYRLERRGAAVVGETLAWRFPGAAADANEVHVNSLAAHRGRLLASAFGERAITGKVSAKGVIVEVGSGRVVAGGLCQPHSLAARGERLYVAESGARRVCIGTPDGAGFAFAAVDTGGYPRGLLAGDDGLIVGVSAHRRVSRSRGVPAAEIADPHDRCELLIIDEAARRVIERRDLSAHGLEIYDVAAVEGVRPGPPHAPHANPLIEALRLGLDRLRAPWRTAP